MSVWVSLLVGFLTIVGWLSISYFQSKGEEYEDKFGGKGR